MDSNNNLNKKVKINVTNSILNNDKENNIIVKTYTLPNTNILKDNESKNIIPYIKVMKKLNKVSIPIGIYQDKPLIENPESMPNMLVCGTVMSGKTSYINTILGSILMTKKPLEVKLVIFDSRKVDYSIYRAIPHLLFPIITDIKEFNAALSNICLVIDERIKLLNNANVKKLDDLNAMLNSNKKLYTILIVIDDFNILNASDEIKRYIEYISSNGWKVNISMIISTNYPSSKVIPLISKINFPARLCFRVNDVQTSRLVIGDKGAEKLNGLGSALYTSRFTPSIINIKVPYITDSDIKNIVAYSKSQEITHYVLDDSSILKNIHYSNEDDDVIYNDVLKFAIKNGKIDASLIQRVFKVGYNKAARLIDLLEERGIIGPNNGSKPRDVLVKIEK